MTSSTGNLTSTAPEPTPPDRSSRIFARHRYDADLKRTAVRGAAVTGVSQAGKMVLRFGSTAILARLLSPEDYGLVAMTAVITGFVAIFRDAGLTTATVQREEITHSQISTLFWINVALGGFTALLLAALSPAVAAFYQDSRLVPVTAALAIGFVFSGLTVQHQALLRRQMRFMALAVIDLVSMLVGVIVAVLMARAGFRYWSLVGMNLSMAVANTVAVWWMLDWRPGRPRRDPTVRPMLKFGSDVLGFDVINYFARQADTLLIGWWWGAVTLGLYDRAYNMLLMPIRQINAPLAAVAVPALSRARNNPSQFCHYYLNSLQLVTSVSVPFVLVLALFADEFVRLWLGPGWEECAALFRLLAVAAAIGAMSNPIGWLLLSLGQTRRYRQMGMISSAVVVLSFLIGLPHGARGVAIAYSTSLALLFIPTWLYVLKETDIRLLKIMRTLLPPLASCVPATAVALVALRYTPTTIPWLGALLGAIGFGLVYLFVLLVVFRRWRFFQGILNQFRRGGPKISDPTR
ncbi:MAG TPA: lipopolysaccharide biosynthesis protein [Candidatus Synoicihabitans sp.]|nr:lipopolysaccharide biosynthesis protein [Candidatus Synoicihabitans sp.]